MTRKEPPNVSVLVPVYGKFDVCRAKLVVDSIMLQQKVSLQVVIAESGPFPKLEDLAERVGAIHCFRYADPSSDIYSPGRIRNDAILACDGLFVYTNDADIVFQSQSYLHDVAVCVAENERRSLRWPPMRRLPIHCFEQWSRTAGKKGITTALSELQHPNEYISLTNGCKYDLKTRRRPGKLEDYKDGLIFTSTVDDYERYVSDPTLHGLEPMIFHQVRHIGGMFAQRKQLISVGGYCENFLAWGNEDTDIQWKLSEVLDIDFIPDAREFEVLHLDHTKGHFNVKQWKRNKELQKTRQSRAIREAISTDRRTLEIHWQQMQDGDGVHVLSGGR